MVRSRRGVMPEPIYEKIIELIGIDGLVKQIDVTKLSPDARADLLRRLQAAPEPAPEVRHQRRSRKEPS